MFRRTYIYISLGSFEDFPTNFFICFSFSNQFRPGINRSFWKWSKFWKFSTKSVLLLSAKDLYFDVFFILYIKLYKMQIIVKKIYLLLSLFLRKQLTIRYSITILVDQSLCPVFRIRCFLYTYRVPFRHRSLFSMFVQQLPTNCKPDISFLHFVGCEIFSVKSFFSRLQISIRTTWKIVVPVLQVYIYALILFYLYITRIQFKVYISIEYIK